MIVELYDKVPGEYHVHGVSTSSRFGLIAAARGEQMPAFSREEELFGYMRVRTDPHDPRCNSDSVLVARRIAKRTRERTMRNFAGPF
jgi:hypothetical protein